MAARTFTQPSSLNESLATVTMSTAKEDGAGRSMEAAKDAQQAYTAAERAPLANDTNPKSKPGITFASQDTLPKLPIPELDSSCKKYLAALKPLQSSKEHNDTQHAVEDFLKSDGAALQEKLKKYASGKANYIEQFCECPKCFWCGLLFLEIIV
jgi:carnitine O-acetyltransferase